MSLLHCAVLAGVVTLAVVPTALSHDSGEDGRNGNSLGVHTLTVTAASSEAERGIGDIGANGISKSDTYVSTATLRDQSGAVVGSYHVACTITDEMDDQGNAWSICSTTAIIDGRGTLVATGIAQLLQVATAPGGFGVAPPTAELAVVGGTGLYAGAHGQVTSTRNVSLRTLVYRFKL